MRLRQWQQQGLIKRLGLVVKHRTLGYQANAMVVWDVPGPADVRARQRAGGSPFCHPVLSAPAGELPDWPYNLFCMIHGVTRERVRQQLASLIEGHQLQETPYSVLFSSKAYLQRGGRYVSPC